MNSATQNLASKLKTSLGRRSFLKAGAAAGGGLMINFSWGVVPTDAGDAAAGMIPDQPFELNAYLLIASSGEITAMVPNPEFGQNLMTSMPMILAEELDADWKSITAKQANYDARAYERQFTGGSQSIRRAWQSLRMAGASARHMLIQAAAQQWQVPAGEIAAKNSTLTHAKSDKQSSYGAMAAAASQMPTPAEVNLKDKNSFKLIGKSRHNQEGQKIVTGQPLFGIDYQAEGMKIAMIEHPPAFGKTIESANLDEIKKMSGIVDAFIFESMKPDYQKNYFDTNAFPRLIAIVGDKTWQVMKAKKALKAQWKDLSSRTETMNAFGREVSVTIPGGLENTTDHGKKMDQALAGKLDTLREDGDVKSAFDSAETVIERTYRAPYLAHNTLEPMNFFAQITGDGVHVAGPLQAPVFIQDTLASRLGIVKDKIHIEFTRMGGGFGRRAYSHYLVEAAVIAKQVKAPVKLIYSREDDMTMGIYRPSYTVRIKAALDKDNKLVAYHVSGVGLAEHCVHENRFPAGAVDNYLAEGKAIDSNITIGAFRAPRSNFMASAEQSFLDELAEAAGEDPIDFRLALLERAKNNPVGDNNDYDPARYAGVLKLVREKSDWDAMPNTTHKGVAAYFCHNSYAAQVITVKRREGEPKVDKVYSALDCGIVVNKDSAINMVEGAVIDGIGNALFGEMTFTNGVPDKKNFDRYRLIRMNEMPNSIDVHFVDNSIDPTGLGEPPFPPVFPALANALYQAQGERLYQQPYFKPKKPS
ncbi:molybdopterin-dependent oxidoreductase [Gilvimarinus sp. SDUM040013]|uniref:Molybdopterin cofactor-binding domain-containing protein n=1 Tax=Gilvimarinus gilvus TaxID=3058038 RepID=A0ABU4S0G0_9GAMM|nr:molybdopterin cofactor-binding domain-containing protein [Gilvimarinus sp. SDUM040013]MDO3385628.1 molybdopterin-dependent oxidoreductase [Gilvimarinus sp. SDUM040013]MDX6849962.1 molybdopterin cofactor-binding domain-containing protein [Gilvimarinus sp. SDUM040013]